MTEQNLSVPFEQSRDHLRGVAFRMLGSLSEADDAVQETWLRLQRADTSDVENLGGWLTTVVARVCLDMLRARKTRPQPVEHLPEKRDDLRSVDPEQEAVLADSVGLALLVVLDTLQPAERLAFVLHDLFDLSFDEIASIVGRSEEATRQLASRARRRVQGKPASPETDIVLQRKVVEAFLAASRGGDFDALLTVLDPDVVLRNDASMPGGAGEIRGAAILAKRAVAGGARAARPALIDGQVGVVIAPLGRLLMVLRFTLDGERVVHVDGIADPQRLAKLEISMLA